MIKVAFVGLGYWGPNLVRNFMAAPGSGVTRVCDLRAERLSSLGKLYPGIKMCSDASSLINDPEIDAVVARAMAADPEGRQPAGADRPTTVASSTSPLRRCSEIQ